MSDKIRIEEVESVAPPPKARVDDIEQPAAKLERKKDYLDGFLAQKPAAVPAGEPGGDLHDAVIAALKSRFPEIAGPHKEDICYATTNRQESVKQIAPRVDAMIVVGSPNSSNSQRLREVAERAGCKVSALVLRADDIDWTQFSGISRLGITAGASAPEVLVEEIIDAFSERYHVTVETFMTADESVFFPLPRALREIETE